jgi:hypothetical protein
VSQATKHGAICQVLQLQLDENEVNSLDAIPRRSDETFAQEVVRARVRRG